MKTWATVNTRTYQQLVHMYTCFRRLPLEDSNWDCVLLSSTLRYWLSYCHKTIYPACTGDSGSGYNEAVTLITQWPGVSNHFMIKLSDTGSMKWKENIVLTLTPGLEAYSLSQIWNYFPISAPVVFILFTLKIKHFTHTHGRTHAHTRIYFSFFHFVSLGGEGGHRTVHSF